MTRRPAFFAYAGLIDSCECSGCLCEAVIGQKQIFSTSTCKLDRSFEKLAGSEASLRTLHP